MRRPVPSAVPSLCRFASLLAALSLSAAALAQSPASSPPARQVELLAPQLVSFAGSPANFESLVNGLAQGIPVTLTSVSADGVVQIVTFQPGTALSPTDVARTLESARQSLIARGIVGPTPQQLAVALVGGVSPIQVRTEVAAQPVPGTGVATLANISAAELQALRTGLAQNAPVTLTGAGGPVTFGAPGRTMSDFEINQALQLAGLMLAQQGIFDPTPEQLRVALLGGTLGTTAGAVPLRGVLQGRVRNTSDSGLFGTSDSQVVGTSNTPPNRNPAAGAFVGARTGTGAGIGVTAPAPAGAPPAASIATTPRFRAATRR